MGKADRSPVRVIWNVLGTNLTFSMTWMHPALTAGRAPVTAFAQPNDQQELPVTGALSRVGALLEADERLR